MKKIKIGSFEEEVREYYNEITSNPNHRFLSWEHCYEYFYVNKEKIDYDKAALMLFCYLSSWGMLRASFLMDYDYKIHTDMIKTLVYEYKDLWNNEKPSWEQVFKADNYINEYYKETRKTKIETSIVLRSKILLGIFGCLPAYDRFFKDGISCFNLINSGEKILKTFGQNSYQILWNFYEKQQNIQLFLKNDSKIKYPPMKLVDMFFWQIGYKNENNNK